MFSFPRVTCPSTGGMFQQGSTQGHTSPGRATLLLLPICAIAFVCGLAVGNWHASPPVLAASQRGWVIGATAITDVRSLPRNLGQSLLPLQLKETRAPRLYHVGPSTIPGAGLGVFASQDLPPGSVWNPEDVRPESTVTLTRAQWQTLLNTLDIVEAAGFKSTGYHRLLALLNTYCYFNHETQQLVLVLTPSGFTNHAPEGSSRGGGRELQGSGGGAEKQQQGPVANSGFSQDDESGILSATLRDLARGEEIFEDYRTYNNPWPRGAEGAHAYDAILHQQ